MPAGDALDGAASRPDVERSGGPDRARLNFVRPPETTETGRPVRSSPSNRTRRVALTAAASRSGVPAPSRTRRRRPGRLARKLSTGRDPLARLQEGQASVRLETRSDPPVAFGDVVDLERRPPGAAAGACPVPFLEQAFPDLVSRQGPLLALRALDAGALRRLRVEAHRLAPDPGHRRKPPEPFRPGLHVDHPRLQRGREPSPRPRTDFHLQGLRPASGPVPEPHGEGTEARHDGAPVPQERPRPRHMARHQRVAPPVEGEGAAHAALGVARAPPVTPAGAGLPPHILHVRVWIRTVSCLTRRVCGRIFQDPAPRKHAGVGLERMVQDRSDGRLLSRAGQHGPSGRPPLREGSLTLRQVPAHDVTCGNTS